jgi:hypothetical protein
MNAFSFCANRIPEGKTFLPLLTALP